MSDDTTSAGTETETERKQTPSEIAQGVLNEHEAEMYRPCLRHITARDIELPESFFEPTSSELSSAHQLNVARTSTLQNATLRTAKMRKAEDERRMNQFKRCLIRIQLSDRHVLQGVFKPSSTVREVTRFVRAGLKDPKNTQFHLFVVPPKRILSNPMATVWSEGLVPAAIIHMGFDSKYNGPKDAPSLIKDVLLNNVKDIPELEKIEAEQREQKRLLEESIKKQKIEQQQVEEKEKEKEKDKPKKDLKKVVPKWFKK